MQEMHVPPAYGSPIARGGSTDEERMRGAGYEVMYLKPEHSSLYQRTHEGVE